jgi:protoheme IX farnesyltransferase
LTSDVGGTGTVALDRSRFADYLTLVKPELTFLSVITALGGFLFGAPEPVPALLLLHTLVGVGLVGGGAGALNQYLERKYDALMRRTENRPLPSGRLAPREVLFFGSSCSLLGILHLATFVNLLTGALAAVTVVTYLFLYTPLKRITPMATIIGGIPGALPPAMGWTAVRNSVSTEAAVLFAVLFFWQIPHFLSLAWMYRRDYARAGYRILTVLDADGSITGRHILAYCIGLIPTTLLPAVFGYVGLAYAVAAVILGVIFLISAVQFFRSRTNLQARRVFTASLVYLPTLFAFMVADRLW